MLTLGFSDHSPLPFQNTFALKKEELPNYCRTILLLKKKYASHLEILLGLEIDYIPGFTISLKEYRQDFLFDYVIGSVHFVKDIDPVSLWFIDGPEISSYENGLMEIFNGDARRAVTTYYRQIQEMVVEQRPDIVGHLDKVKMFNRDRFFSEGSFWYQALIDDTLHLIEKQGCVIEVNTRGIYKKRSESLFPGLKILKKIHERKIPITLCSDAHKPSEITMYMTEGISILKNIGFRSLMNMTRYGWKEVIIE